MDAAIILEGLFGSGLTSMQIRFKAKKKERWISSPLSSSKAFHFLPSTCRLPRKFRLLVRTVQLAQKWSRFHFPTVLPKFVGTIQSRAQGESIFFRLPGTSCLVKDGQHDVVVYKNSVFSKESKGDPILASVPKVVSLCFPVDLMAFSSLLEDRSCVQFMPWASMVWKGWTWMVLRGLTSCLCPGPVLTKNICCNAAPVSLGCRGDFAGVLWARVCCPLVVYMRTRLEVDSMLRLVQVVSVQDICAAESWYLAHMFFHFRHFQCFHNVCGTSGFAVPVRTDHPLERLVTDLAIREQPYPLVRHQARIVKENLE